MQKLVLGMATLGIVMLAQPTPARACGGCFHDPSQNPTVVTDHRMILSVSLEQTTLYDQIEYTGSPQSFAWVLPIASAATVGLSADVVFDTLDTLTHTAVYPPSLNCPAPPSQCYFGFADASASADAGGGGVNVLKQEVVGPYETVQLQSTDPQALDNWLTSHNYAVPADVQPIIDAYVNEGFDFLAMKLVPGASVQSMRPVRVTTQGASPVLPLRMVGAGTGATVGITLWVIGEGRYEPQNFPWFRIDDSELTWDFATQSSDYASVRQTHEQALNGRGWEMESSNGLALTQFNTYIDNGGSQFNFGADAGADYAPVTTLDGGTESPEQARADDLATLFAGMNTSDIRVTRMRSDIAHSALDMDLTLQASADQSILASNRYPTKFIDAPQCPNYDNCQTYPEAGSDPDQPPFGAVGGCGVSPENDGGGALFAFGALAVMLVNGVMARRRKR